MKARTAADPFTRFAGCWRTLPFEAILIGIGLFALLAAFVGADPSTRITVSSSPFTDEAFNTINARNLIQLGTWSTDQWNLHLVNLPFSLLEAIWFRIVGVGIVQARLIAIACVSLCAAAVARSIELSASKYCTVSAQIASGTARTSHRYTIKRPGVGGAPATEESAEVIATGPNKDVLAE